MAIFSTEVATTVAGRVLRPPKTLGLLRNPHSTSVCEGEASLEYKRQSNSVREGEAKEPQVTKSENDGERASIMKRYQPRGFARTSISTNPSLPTKFATAEASTTIATAETNAYEAQTHATATSVAAKHSSASTLPKVKQKRSQVHLISHTAIQMQMASWLNGARASVSDLITSLRISISSFKSSTKISSLANCNTGIHTFCAR